MAGAADDTRGVSASAPPAAATNSRNLRREENLVSIDAFTLHLVGLATPPTCANTARLPGTPPAIKEPLFARTAAQTTRFRDWPCRKAITLSTTPAFSSSIPSGV